MKEKDFIGKKVVSIKDGASVGKIEDLIFKGLELSALVVKGDRGEGILPLSGLVANGPDAITIHSYTVVDWSAGPVAEKETRNTHDLRKLSVVDDKGNSLGHMHDFMMNSSGRILSIEVRSGGVLGIGSHDTVVEGSEVCAIGENLITVKSANLI